MPNISATRSAKASRSYPLAFSSYLQKVGILLAENGFVAILEKLPMAPVTTIKGERISGEKSAHDSGDWLITGLQEKMHVIGQ